MANGDYFILRDNVLRKLDGQTGAAVWEVVTASGHGPIALDADGNPMVAGSSTIWKFSAASGAVVWSSAAITGTVNTFAADASGSIYAAGSGTTTTTSCSQTTPSFVWKFDAASGALLSTTQVASGSTGGVVVPPNFCLTLHGNSVTPLRIVVDAKGFPFIALGKNNFDSEQSGALIDLLRLDSASGSVLWTKTVASDSSSSPGTAFDSLIPGLTTDASGDVFVSAAVTDRFFSPPATLARLAASTGATVWSENSAAGPVALLPGGDLVHRTDGRDPGTGALKWSSPAVFTDLQSIAVSGNLVLVGGTDNGTSNPRAAAAAFEAGTGQLFWTFTQDGGAPNSQDGPTRVTFHGCGAAYVSAQTQEPTGSEVHTFKLTSAVNPCE